MTPLLMLLACAGTPSSLLAPTLSADRWTQAALLPPTWIVCPGTGDFDTIQEAIDAASDGDTIEVCTGTYDEDLVIEKPLTLIDDGGMTTIDGSGTTSVIAIDTAGLVTIEGFVIQGGAATNGGGINATGTDLTLDLRDNLVQRNTATGMGGGVYVGRGVDGLFTENVFQLNVADMGGGIASMMSDVTIQSNHLQRNDCTTTDATAYTNGGGGGGVFVQGGANIIDNWIHADDSTLHGGGGFFYESTGEISLNRVHDNTSVGDGAGFSFDYSLRTAVRGNEFYLNQAGDDGGAMHASGIVVTITDNHFYDNDAAGDGGALQISGLGQGTLSGNTFEYNVAGDRGGAVQLENTSTLRLTSSTFVGNSAARGGGLHSWLPGPVVRLSEVTFEGNSATECGGAIAIDNHPLTLRVLAATLTDNTAPNGAAFCMTHEWTDEAMTEADRSSAILENVLLVDNVASSASGAFHIEFGALQVWYGTIVGTSRGTMSVADGDSLSIYNTIFADGVGPFARIDGTGTVRIRNSLFWNNRGGWGDIAMPIGINGNISGDPLFVDPASGDFSLDPSSPAVGAAPRDTDIGKAGGRLGW